MTEAEWLVCENSLDLLGKAAERGTMTERQYRLFACACLRAVWHLVTDERSRVAVERMADGEPHDANVESASKSVPGGFYGTTPEAIEAAHVATTVWMLMTPYLPRNVAHQAVMFLPHRGNQTAYPSRCAAPCCAA